MFYVYELIDPRDLSTFYVGKGQGDRVRAHVRDARAGRISNEAKHARIVDILACGRTPLEMIVGRFEEEDAALDHEAMLMEEIGLENLTNILPRGTPTENAARVLRRIIEVAESDIARAESPELVAFAREGIVLANLLMQKARELCPA
jgi:hypothetical protein